MSGFGPVLSVISYKDDEDAVKIANDTVYGLAAYVQFGNIEHARKVAAQLRAGQVSINYPEWDTFAPFGGYKQSGNGREYADWAIHVPRGQGHYRLRGVAGLRSSSPRRLVCLCVQPPAVKKEDGIKCELTRQGTYSYLVLCPN